MTNRRGLTIGSAAVVAILTGAVFLMASPKAPAQTAPNDLPVVSSISVTAYQLVSQTRISATVFDYTYRVSVRNTGPALIVVTGRANSTATNVTFPDNVASFGDIASGTPANSVDTIVIRQDRSQPFNTNQVAWQFTAAPGDGIPPDPGPANDLTIEGIDSDNDGIRDDIERYIAISVPSSARHREALHQLASVIQRELLAQTVDESIEFAARGVRSIECLSYLGLRKQGRWKEVQAAMINTPARLSAIDIHSQRINGQVFTTLPDSDRRTACEFGVESLPN